MTTLLFRDALAVAIAMTVVGCGGSSSAIGTSDGGAVTGDAGATTEGDDGAATGGDAGTSTGDADALLGAEPEGGLLTIDGGTASLADRTSAVKQTVAGDALCMALPAFYWEIGDVSGPLASGAVGTTFKADTEMNIASASKFVFGAYVVERFKDDLTKMDASAMRMLSGYTSLDYSTCVASKTVSDCLMTAKNDTYTASDLGLFFYNGGHFQNYAVTLGLGGDSNDALAKDVKAKVGTEFSFTYGSPQLAGGIKTSAADYAAFLRKILAARLAIHDHLGEKAVCTLPSACSTAVSSPAPAAWHYSYAHWVEDDPTTGDGAFSSPGAFGFYPWIDATKTYYGIVARYSLEAKAYVESAECGIVMRKAFMTATKQ